MKITFRGIRTSLAFFELICISTIILLNISPFLSSINLANLEPAEFKTSLLENHFKSAFLFKDNEIHDINYCAVGLFVGFSIATLMSLIRGKKAYLAYFAKFCLAIYTIKLFYFWQNVK